MDAAVVQDVRGQCRAAPTALTSISAMSADAGDARADQGLVTASLKDKLIMIGAKVVSHDRYIL
jgi:hypothetical protein